MEPRKAVCVVGAGIIGLSVATHLLEKYPEQLDVTVVADKFTPNTDASDKTGGLVIPPRAVFPCPDLATAERWFSGSLNRFEKLERELGMDEVGIRRAQGYFFPDKSDIWWAHLFSDFHRVEKDCWHFPQIDTQENKVYSYTSYVVNGTVYLRWLLNRFSRVLGGSTRKHFVNSMSELANYDIVINCTGLGARELANDANVYPSKGHMLLVDAPWINQWIFNESIHSDSAYVFTRNDGIILGTTRENYKEDFEISAECKQKILNDCQTMVPSLKRANIRKCWTGVRPMRKGGVRLELDRSMGQSTTVIHCYGHGSIGVSLSWGSALDVGRIVGERLGMDNVLQSKI